MLSLFFIILPSSAHLLESAIVHYLLERAIFLFLADANYSILSFCSIPHILRLVDLGFESIPTCFDLIYCENEKHLKGIFPQKKIRQLFIVDFDNLF